MKARDSELVGALRMVLSELQKAAKEGGDELAVLRRERKRRLEAAEQFRQGGRPELAGSKDAVLRSLEGHLDCDIYLRGNVLTLDGDSDAVDSAALVVRELAELIAQGHAIGPGTIEAVKGALDQHESPARILEDVV